MSALLSTASNGIGLGAHRAHPPLRLGELLCQDWPGVKWIAAKRLLGHPEGGSLAFIGLIDRTRGLSYRWPRVGGQLLIIRSTLAGMLGGHPVGSAARYLSDRLANLAINVCRAVAEPDSDDQALADRRTAYVDPRSFLLLGNPAVRLRTRG